MSGGYEDNVLFEVRLYKRDLSVDDIIIENGVVKGVLMNNGDIIPAKNVVSATGIRTTFENLVNKCQVPTIYKNIPKSLIIFNNKPFLFSSTGIKVPYDVLCLLNF